MKGSGVRAGSCPDLFSRCFGGCRGPIPRISWWSAVFFSMSQAMVPIWPTKSSSYLDKKMRMICLKNIPFGSMFGGLSIFGIFLGQVFFLDSCLFAFPAALLFCFSCFCAFPACLPFWFSVFLLLFFPVSLLFCLSAFLLFLLLCFSVSLLSLLLCFPCFSFFSYCASVPFYLYYFTFPFLQSCVFAAPLPAPLLIYFLSLLSLCFSFSFAFFFPACILNEALERP